MPETEEFFVPRTKSRTTFFTRCRPCFRSRQNEQRSARKKNSRKNGCPVEYEIVPNLSVIPIREWLKPRMREFSTYETASRLFRVDATLLRRIVTDPEKVLVSMDTVDRILVGFECSPSVLPELYPELYAF